MKHIIIGRGKAGWHSSGLSTWDGGKTWNRCSSSGAMLETYLSEAEDGCLIYDADAADTDAFARLVITGPMCDASLEPGTVHPFGDDMKRAALGMLPGLSGGFETLAAMAISGLGSLDTVAPDVYIQLLKERVPGVKTGKVINHLPVWDE